MISLFGHHMAHLYRELNAMKISGIKCTRNLNPFTTNTCSQSWLIQFITVANQFDASSYLCSRHIRHYIVLPKVLCTVVCLNIFTQIRVARSVRPRKWRVLNRNTCHVFCPHDYTITRNMQFNRGSIFQEIFLPK